MLLSYSLLFSRNAESRKIATKLFTRKEMNVVFLDEVKEEKGATSRTVEIIFWDAISPSVPPMAAHFNHFRGHLLALQTAMSEWKPRTVRELLQPGYKDRFTWYATIIALFISLIGTAGVILGILQIIVAFKAYNLQKLQSP
jgi:hypothetical protein